MGYVPRLQQHYYNPTTNRIPTSVTENHFRMAEQDTARHVFEGIDTDRSDDIATPWVTIRAKAVTVPIQPLTMVTLEEYTAAKKEDEK